jgi:hypothetical protein
MKPGAIFISYAREDQAAARRLRDFLQEAGLDVWFVTRRLAAGDDWNNNTRRSIRNCSYFVALISSATTRRRLNAYFRFEWALAVDRARVFPASDPFIIPVVIDDTPEQPGAVPEWFLQLHWTRFAGGSR